MRRAFAVFVEGMGTWWPAEYTWSGPVLHSVGIEPREGGMCWERGPRGFRCDRGRVAAFEPPGRIVVTWQITPDRLPQPDPARASEVEARFVGVGSERTRLNLEHRAFERHGEDARPYRDGMGSPGGWPRLLERWAAAVEGRELP